MNSNTFGRAPGEALDYSTFAVAEAIYYAVHDIFDPVTPALDELDMETRQVWLDFAAEALKHRITDYPDLPSPGDGWPENATELPS